MYTVDYFIKKFEAIPINKWCCGDLTKIFRGEVLSCAAGFCGVTVDGIDIKMTEEGECLGKLLSPLFVDFSTPHSDDTPPVYTFIYKINDSSHPKYDQPTPKQRILAALQDIKKIQQPEPPIAKEQPTRIVYVAIDAAIKEQQLILS